MITYTYTMQGTANRGQSWTTHGEISTEQPGDFFGVLAEAQLDSFMQLTEGKAVFGKPGLGCDGPYQILRFLVERRSDA